MTRFLTVVFKLVGYPVITLALFLMLTGPALFLNSLSQRYPSLAVILGYLLAFYAPAIVSGFNKGMIFSSATLKAGLWCVGLLVMLHLGSLLFHFGSFGTSLVLVFLFAFAQERGIIVPKTQN
ncbi:MAG: hypothetical protein JW892_07845 [Anaerolineae bacterium]|nr:hypothetical protein [Anaerolineae bacterium]